MNVVKFREMSRYGPILFFFGLLLMLPLSAVAQGPKVIAKMDRLLWPDPINTRVGFDRASRASILIYYAELRSRRELESGSLARPRVIASLDREISRAQQNYRFASSKCTGSDWTCIGSLDNAENLPARTIPLNLSAWATGLRRFVSDYLGEQIRLAAVFDRTSSEIDLFNSNEWNGDDLADRQFFLTFDDGPTANGGNTDGVLEMLLAQKKSGVFFVLGNSFQSQLSRASAAETARRYRGQCVASHGWEHISHEKGSRYAAGTEWQRSVSRTDDLVRATFADTGIYRALFRPPYGQRKADSGEFFQDLGIQVALWDLDSQDWNAKVDAADIIDRMETLILIKRHGVLLFHDVHPKAARALPVILNDLGNSVDWGDCHQLGGSADASSVRLTLVFQTTGELSDFVPGKRVFRADR